MLYLRKTAVLTLSLTGIAWVLTGCGGGSGPATAAGNASPGAAQASTQATPALAPGDARFIGSTGAVCRRRVPGLEAANIYTNSVAAIIAAARTRASIERAGLRELEALTPPRSMVGDWASYMADAKSVLTDLTKLANLGANPERASLEAWYGAYFKQLEQMHALAQRLGLAGCTLYG